ncbi:MAG TPA: hypothetical protein VGR43_05175, partial [Dehalococcoidia bacterium]|nr:hypothetical protein [Dehalococcoidia bacterium]
MKTLAGFFAFVLAFALLSACSEQEVGVDGLFTTESPSPTLLPPTPTLIPTPSDWPTYTDPGGLYTLRYPAGWFQSGTSFSSKDPGDGHAPIADLIEVEVGYNTAAGSSTCGGAISVDPTTGEEVGPLDGASSASLG